MIKQIRILLATALVMSGLSTASARPATPDTISATRAFISLPQTICPVLNEDNKLSMVDYFRAGIDRHTVNFLKGESWLTALTDRYAAAQISEVSRLQLRILPLKKRGQMVVAAYTVANNDVAPDSDLFFFDAHMNPVPAKKVIRLPELETFFSIPRGSLTSMKEIKQMIPYFTVEYTLSADTDVLTARIYLAENINRDDLKIISLFLRDTVTYSWNGSRFIMDK